MLNLGTLILFISTNQVHFDSNISWKQKSKIILLRLIRRMSHSVFFDEEFWTRSIMVGCYQIELGGHGLQIQMSFKECVSVQPCYYEVFLIYSSYAFFYGSSWSSAAHVNFFIICQWWINRVTINVVFNTHGLKTAEFQLIGHQNSQLHTPWN